MNKITRSGACARRLSAFSLMVSLILTLTVWLPPTANAQQGLGIAAIVNDEIISVFDLNERLRLILSGSPKKPSPETIKRLSHQVLRLLIDERIKMQEAKRVKVSIDPENINAAFEEIARQRNTTSRKMREFLIRNGIDLSSLFDQIEAQLTWARIISRLYAKRVTVNDDEVDQQIALLRANEGKPELLVTEIFLPYDNPDMSDEIFQLANRLLQQVRDGANFSELARNFSQGATAARGGDLGWIMLGQFDNQVAAVLASMKSGQVTNPVETAGGYNIYAIRDRRLAAPFGKNDITLSLSQIALPLNPDPTDQELNQQVTALNSLGARAKNCADMDQLAKETGSPLSGRIGSVKLSSLPDRIKSVVGDLAIGTPSKVTRIREGLAILMICDRKGELNELSIRAIISEKMLQEKLTAAANRHLRELKRAAFVDIR